MTEQSSTVRLVVSLIRSLGIAQEVKEILIKNV